jgi:uncharacterized paraquat-inducible protein A
MKKILKKLRTFAQSLWFHIWAGFPKASHQQINDRYNICIKCEMFDAQNSQCLVCGCNLSQKKVFLNKLAWADQQCPINKWSKVNGY